MKRSDAAAISAGTVTAIILGVASSLLFPLAGLVAGAYFTVTAVAAAGMGTAATWALGAAGAIGGLAVGRILKPLAVWSAVGLGFTVGGVTKLATALAGVLSRAFKKAPIVKNQPGIFSRLKSALKPGNLKQKFSLFAGKAAAKKSSPQKEPQSKPAL